MTTISERYARQPLSFLVNVIENSVDYQPEAVETAKAEVRKRNPEQGDLLQLARNAIGARIDAYLDSFSVVNDQLELPESYFLNEEEVKLVFRSCFARWKEENDDMTPDSWLYVLGAGFG